jgi:glutamate dehydrogenase
MNSAAMSTRRQIQTLLERWRGGLDEASMPLFKAFVDDTLNRLRGPFLAQHPPTEVLEVLEIAFTFARERAPDDVKVDVRPGPKKGAIVLSSMLDQSFIVDTIRLFLRRNVADYWGGFNLVFNAQRDASGALVGVGGDRGRAESLVLLESDNGTLLDDRGASVDVLRENLQLAHAMVSDFAVMTRTVERAVEKCEAQAEREPARADAWNETAAFLKWLLRDNFVFMGMEMPDPMGIQRLRGSYHNSSEGDWPPPHEPGTVKVRKSRIESPVHRTGRIDEILVGMPGSGTLFIRGLFTYRAVTQPSRNVPILRGVLAAILQEQQSDPGSFRYKGIANVFDSLPTEFLFTARHKAIAEMVDLVFEAEQQQEVGVTFLMTGPDSAFCLVAMPKAQYSDDLRRDVESEIVATLKATYSDHGLFIGRYDTVLLHYYLTGVVFPGDTGVQKMTDNIRQIATPWLARLWHAFAAQTDDKTADRLADTYGRAFPDLWVRSTPVERAVRDIEMLEQLAGTKNVTADVWLDQNGALKLGIYQARDVYLTDILPVLDNFGLVVIDSSTVPVRPRGGVMHIDIFRLQPYKSIDTPTAIIDQREKLMDAIEAVFADEVESDRLNELVLSAGLAWSEVDVIRGYARYSRQLNVKVSMARTQEILLSNPAIVRHLVDLFHARFDVGIAGREAATTAAEGVVKDDLRKLKTHDEDLLVGTLLTLICATIRTNYYRADRVFHYLSFKLDASKVPQMGARRPLYEIYVHHKEVEGVHLRFGKVARGGLRWSDRDDYRTEVLGLVTTQQVKNVVIVPEGAKGGFLLKRPSRDPAQRRVDADRHYQTFIRGLLDLTDNSKDGRITKPPDVVCHDGDDPYLVVAADKGTAHLSDTANALSLAYGHWLGDAFASGGSVGYDHKKVGITARGGWVLVKRHFAELGVDPYSQTFTCSGIGDLSGDVFGNGLIESPHCKLFAAFNHLHIFIDPDPDPKSSFDERLRLFKAERKGGWENYDKTKISKGGGVFERAAKSIPLSPEAQKLLGLPFSEAEPDVVIKQILLMEVDLLWNGGIGTYVKASTETHADADDKSNDAIRVDGNQLRAKIMGEGGNLGCTQRGRIEAALNGVRLNTDAIDNSGGVDMSDHEVNLKILLDRVVARGDMTLADRNALLARMTDEVAELVMADNDAHGRQLSRDQVRSKLDVFQFGRAIGFVERVMGQTRDALRLPTDKELAKRAEAGLGLTRPELSVLQAWVKMYVYRELLRGDPKALPGYDELLVGYFPNELQKTFAKDIRGHMLANEIAMTVATTRIVADAGAAFVPVMIESSGRTVGEIAAAYVKAQELAGVPAVRAELETISIGDTLATRYKAWVRLDAGVREVVGQWMSAKGETPGDDAIAAMSKAVDIVCAAQPNDVAARDRDQIAEMVRAGLSEAVAARIAKAPYAAVAIVLEGEARRSGSPLAALAVRHVAVGRATRLQDVLDDLARRPATGRWDPIALQILSNRYFNLQRKLVSRVKTEAGGADELANSLATGSLAGMRATVDEMIGRDPTPSIASLIVLEERLAGAVARLPAEG